jgi:inner membrane protein
VLAAGTDGTDGPTDAAGALVDAGTVARGRAAGSGPGRALADNDAHAFLTAAGDLIVTGPTNTNLLDLYLVLKSVAVDGDGLHARRRRAGARDRLPAPGPAARLLAGRRACAVIPDLDVIGLSFGIPWGHVLGHRGFTHSVCFAALLATVVLAMIFRGRDWDGRRVTVWIYPVRGDESHGVLDAMTHGGSGVAFWAPFDDGRYFLPWRPIPVSPIGSRFFTERGAAVLRVELLLVWLPAAAFAAGGVWANRRREH